MLGKVRVFELLKIGIPYRYDDEMILAFLASRGFRLGQRVPNKFFVACSLPKCLIYLVNSNMLPELVEEGVLDAALIPSADYREAKSFAVSLCDLNLIVGRLMLGVPQGVPHVPLKELPIGTVLTRTPVLTKEFLVKNGLGWKMRVVRGRMESLSPIFGKKFGVVEYVRTGRSMELNGVMPVATITTSSVILVANPEKARTRELQKIKRMLASSANRSAK